MKNKAKKLLCFVAAATMLASTLSLTACGGNYSLDNPLTLPTGEAVVSNGGFAVEKGEYVYFINGAEDYTANNTYGEAVKGSLMRIKKENLTAGTSVGYASAETVIPMLISPSSTNAGIYIFGDYVYYATPSTDKSVGTGTVNSSNIEFKRAKLDGSNVMKDYYFRLSNNSTEFRFVEVDGTVYCLYEDGTSLKSYNTKTDKTTLLVSGASDYFYDMTEDGKTDPNVYYTMNVTENIETKYASAMGYNQIYCVNAAATSKLDSKDAAYTVYDETGAEYRKYDFNGKELKKNNEEFDSSKISTYPYVNLGKLVVDGIGKISAAQVAGDEKLPYNDSETEKNEDALQGFTYTIQRYENGGVYYTKAAKDTSSYTPELLFYKPTAGVTAVKANENAVEIAEDTANTGSALFTKVADKDAYLYISGDNLYIEEVGLEKDPLLLTSGVSGKTLWRTVGDYVYYYGAGSSGNQLSRIDYTGDADKYDPLLGGMDKETEEKYKAVTFDYVDFNNAWYKPEIIGDVLLYSNATTVGSISYNYIYAASLNVSVEEKNEEYQASMDYLENDLTIDMKSAAQYLFHTYKRDVADTEQKFFSDWADVKAEEDFDWKEAFDRINADETEENGPIWKFKNELKVESDFINLIGKVNEDDQAEIDETWKTYLPFEIEDDAKEEGLAWWIITLIVVGSVLVVAAAVIVPIVVIRKQKAKAEAEATVNAYKRVKIDTTDDKSIDVYADEESEKTEE